MKKSVFKYGLYGSVTISILFLSSWFLGDELGFATKEIIGYVSMIVSLSFVYFGIKHFRDLQNNGHINFKKGLLIGVLISVIIAFVFGVLDVIYIKYINPDFLNEYYDAAIVNGRENFSIEEFKIKLAEIEAEKELFSNTLISFFIMAMTVFIIGLLISLLSALLLQRKKQH